MNLLDDLANVVDAGMRGGVHLDHVDMAAFHDRLAVFARHGKVDGRLVNRIGLVVERARQNARRRGLADPANAGEHPGLRDATRLERVLERADHRLLADEIVEILGAIFAGENAIGPIGSKAGGFCVHELPFRSSCSAFSQSPVWTGRMSDVNQRGCPSTVVGVVRKGGRLAR